MHQITRKATAQITSSTRSWLRTSMTYLQQPFRNSIVFRSTFIVLGAALLVGSLFATFGYYSLYYTEQSHTKVRMRNLIATVENSASIACYLIDQHLAAEVANGLLKNEDVHRVRIFTDDAILSDVRKIGNSIIDSARVPLSTSNSVVTRDLFSPYNPEEKVCKITLVPDNEYIAQQANSKASFLVYFLILQAIVMAATVVIVVIYNISRPITKISGKLHRLSATTGELIDLPRGNKDDEIGQLVTDVNTLVSNIVRLLDEERQLRIRHAVGEKKFKTIFENSETGIFLLKPNGEVISHNQAFLRILAIPNTATTDEISTAFHATLDGQNHTLDTMLNEAQTDSRIQSEDFCIELGQPPQKKWIHIVFSSVEEDVVQGLVNDITERKQGEENANQLAVTDHLTGAYNRLGFEREMEQLAHSAAKGRHIEVFLFLIDLDRFKEVNDTYGHDAGDKVLRYFNQLLIKTLRKTDFIARLGGDEFIVLLKDLSQKEKVEEIAKKILEQLTLPIDIGDNQSVTIGASIGITYSGNQSFDETTLLRQADEAMYAVKNKGKNAYEIYSAS